MPRSLKALCCAIFGVIILTTIAQAQSYKSPSPSSSTNVFSSLIEFFLLGMEPKSPDIENSTQPISPKELYFQYSPLSNQPNFYPSEGSSHFHSILGSSQLALQAQVVPNIDPALTKTSTILEVCVGPPLAGIFSSIAPALLQSSPDYLLIDPGNTCDQIDNKVSKTDARYIFFTQAMDVECIQQIAVKYNKVAILAKTNLIKDAINTLERRPKHRQVTYALNIPQNLSQMIAIHGRDKVDAAGMTEESVKSQYQIALKQYLASGAKILDLSSQEYPEKALVELLQHANEDDIIVFVSHIAGAKAILSNGISVDISDINIRAVFWAVGCHSASRIAFNNEFGGGVVGSISYSKALSLSLSIGKVFLQNSTESVFECLRQLQKRATAKGSIGMIANNIIISQSLDEKPV